MLRRFSINFVILTILLDLVLVILAFVIAVKMRPGFNSFPGVTPILVPVDIAQPLFYILPLGWMVINFIMGLYDERNNLRFVDEFTKLVETTLVAASALAGLLYLSYREISRFLFLSFVLVAFLMMLAWRVLTRVIRRSKHRKFIKKRHVLIIGAGNIGRQTEAAIKENSNNHIHLIGFLDDEPHEDGPNNGILGKIDALETVMVTHPVDEIVIALPPNSHSLTTGIIEKLRMASVTVWVIPDAYLLSLSGASIKSFGGIPMLNLRPPAITDFQCMSKRVFDFVFAFFLLIFLAPLMVLIALLIKWSDQGPVIFRQRRVGENVRLFDMYKFRTMVVGAENLRHTVETRDENGNIIHKNPDDPRVTSIGKFLRRHSLDELPQLFNVLKGDMSLVGPRPELPYMVEQYKPWQFIRFNIPQGLTGWWQVNGRSDKPMHLNTQDDLYYIAHYSFWLDIKILIKTVIVATIGKGAF
jgi:exopolysaccharide biosynthesis polyprenyl glycosylphosphotransferase